MIADRPYLLPPKFLFAPTACRRQIHCVVEIRVLQDTKVIGLLSVLEEVGDGSGERRPNTVGEQDHIVV